MIAACRSVQVAGCSHIDAPINIHPQISALMKKHNFSAGPSILDESVIRDAAGAVLNYQGTGLSILEVSHRAKESTATMEEARNLMKELLDVPEGYEVLFLGGGASLQFAQVPMNLLKKKAAYVDSGTWANKAAKEAKAFR